MNIKEIQEIDVRLLIATSSLDHAATKIEKMMDFLIARALENQQLRNDLYALSDKHELGPVRWVRE